MLDALPTTPRCTLKTARTLLFDDALPTTVRPPHLKLCPSQIGEFFLPHPVLTKFDKNTSLVDNRQGSGS